MINIAKRTIIPKNIRYTSTRVKILLGILSLLSNKHIRGLSIYAKAIPQKKGDNIDKNLPISEKKKT